MTNSLAGVEFLRAFAIGTGWLVIGVGLVQSAIHLAHLAIARRVLGKTAIEPRSEILWQRYSDVAPPIALLVPAYNEEKTIVESIHSLLVLAYPYTEIIVAMMAQAIARSTFSKRRSNWSRSSAAMTGLRRTPTSARSSAHRSYRACWLSTRKTAAKPMP